MRRRSLLQSKESEDDFIDLGLSVKWATCNIGATSPEEYGWYFMWGGTIPYNSDRTPVGGGPAINFGMNSDCPYWVSGSDSLSKWSKYTFSNNNSYTGIADNKLILDPEDDAAHVHLGGNCRMPTKSEFNELLDACNGEWVTKWKGTSRNGLLLTLKSDSSKTLFFPASGSLIDGSWFYDNSVGYCWSSSMGTSGSWYSHGLTLYSTKYNMTDARRSVGWCVRGVKPNLKPGVYIEDIKGELYTKSTWDSSKTPNSIVVISDDCNVRLALNGSPSTVLIYSSSTGELEKYMTETNDFSKAKADYNGKKNTANIMKLQSSTSYAAGYCNNFTFPDGKTKGHLPSLGELWTLYQNKAEVDACLSACGGTAMNTSDYHWSSTFWGVGSSSGIRYCWILRWSDGDVDYNSLNTGRRVRPVANYEF